MPITDDLDDLDSPPRSGKLHPPAEMDEVTPTLDDEARRYRHHPSEPGAVEFGFDPDAADAAADMAGELGAAFLEGATRGEDLSELEMNASDRGDEELPMLLDEEADEPVADEGPRAVRQRPFEAPGALGQDSAREARPSERGSAIRKPKR